MDWFSFFFVQQNIKSFNLETLVMRHQGTHRAVINLLQLASTQCGIGPVHPHRIIVNLIQLASTQCGVGPVCVEWCVCIIMYTCIRAMLSFTSFSKCLLGEGKIFLS